MFRKCILSILINRGYCKYMENIFLPNLLWLPPTFSSVPFSQGQYSSRTHPELSKRCIVARLRTEKVIGLFNITHLGRRLAEALLFFITREGLRWTVATLDDKSHEPFIVSHVW